LAYRGPGQPLAAYKGQAHQKTCDTGDDSGSVAGSGVDCEKTGGCCAQDVLAGRKNAVRPISVAPIAEFKGLILRSHRTDGEDRGQSSRNIQTFAPLITSCSHDQNAVLGALSNGVGKDGVSGPRRLKVTAANIYYIGPELCGLQQCTREVNV
jgi:hypothetical protein